MTKLLMSFISLILILPSSLSAQGSSPGTPRGAKRVQVRQLEVPEGNYTRVPSSSQRFSPAYRFSSSRFFTTQVNVSFNGRNIVGDAANEPSIAIDPTDSNNMVIGWRQFNTISSSFRQAGYGYSTNGGQSWTFPGVIDSGVFRSDPVLDADADGNFYYNSLTVSGNDYLCTVYKSPVGGAFFWDAGTFAHGGDKQWMVVDRTNSIGKGNQYASWTSSFSSCLPGFFTRSTDQGASFEDCTPIPGYPYWGTQAVGQTGTLYLCGWGDTTFLVGKSSTADNSGATMSWDTVTQVSLDGSIAYGLEPNPGGLAGQTWIAVDNSGGPLNGNVYLLCSVQRQSTTDPLDVMFARSSDGGLTWSSPVRVNDDTSTTAYQWFGTMSVAPNGRIDVVWLDTRDNPGTVLSSLYYSFSIDGGVTWSPNERLSQAFDPHVGWPQQNKMGDYYQMISDNNGAHLAWSATFNGEEDVYYGRITENASTTARSISVSAKWNLVSLPLFVSDSSRGTLFPTAASHAFAYQGTTYVVKDTLATGIGYWLKFPASTTVTLNGSPVVSDSFALVSGWNLIGSISSPIPVSSITSNPPGMVTSRFFGYKGAYQTIDTLYPGMGSWVKVNQPGTLFLSLGSSASLAKTSANARIRISPTSDSPPPPPNVDESPATLTALPREYQLDQNYPNPFNPATEIRYALPEQSNVILMVYDVLGQVVDILAEGNQEAGYHQASWNAADRASGLYFYKLEATSARDAGRTFAQVRKMVLLK